MAWFDDLNLPGCTVTGHFAFVREDGPDEDEHPDVQRASGWVTFRPTAPAVRAGGAWAGISPIEAQIFEGEIVVSEEDLRPVRLLSSDADTGVENWGWEATFDIPGAKLPKIKFRAPAAGVHLTGDALIPITGLPVEIIAAGALDRLVTAEDLIAAHGTRLTDVESTVTAHAARLDTLEDRTAEHGTRLTAVEALAEGAQSATTAVTATVDQIKLANQSAGEGAPSGTAPVGWVYTDITTGDVYRMEA